MPKTAAVRTHASTSIPGAKAGSAAITKELEEERPKLTESAARGAGEGCGTCVHVASVPDGIYRAIFRRVPATTPFPRSLFRLLMRATVVSNNRAIEERVSPRLTR